MKRTIDSFFKKRGAGKTDVTATTSIEPFVSPEGSEPDKCPSKSPKLNSKDFEAFCFERDPGLRQQIWNCPPNKRDELRRAYIKDGPYQHHLSTYPFNEDKHPRRFQASCFKLFPDWFGVFSY